MNIRRVTNSDYHNVGSEPLSSPTRLTWAVYGVQGGSVPEGRAFEPVIPANSTRHLVQMQQHSNKAESNDMDATLVYEYLLLLLFGHHGFHPH